MKAACLSFRKPKLFNTCSMNYITVSHMDCLLHKHTHFALHERSNSQMETNDPVSYLSPPVLAFSRFVDRPALHLYLLAVIRVCLLVLAVADGLGFTASQFLMLGKL